jgi:hypothetical protein
MCVTEIVVDCAALRLSSLLFQLSLRHSVSYFANRRVAVAFWTWVLWRAGKEGRAKALRVTLPHLLNIFGIDAKTFVKHFSCRKSSIQPNVNVYTSSTAHIQSSRKLYFFSDVRLLTSRLLQAHADYVPNLCRCIS